MWGFKPLNLQLQQISPSLLCLLNPWCSSLVLDLPLLVGYFMVSVLYPERRGESSSLLGLTYLVELGRGKGTADTVGICGECPPQPRSAGSHHSLRQVVCFPRGVGPGLLVPQQSQAAQALRKVWAVTCVHSQLGGSCDSWC